MIYKRGGNSSTKHFKIKYNREIPKRNKISTNRDADITIRYPEIDEMTK